MENHIYTKQSGRFALPQFQMFGVVLIILGAYLVYILNPFSIVALVVGAALSTAGIGVQSNFQNRTHREYVAIFANKIGKWSKLPAIEYVTVFVEHYSQQKAVVSITSEDSKFSSYLNI